MKTVLLFRSSFCRSNLLEYESVFAYAQTHGWRVQTVEYMNAATSRYRLQATDAGPDIRDLFRIWKPDGCIVECGIAPRTLMKKDFGKVPTVFLDRDPDTIERDAFCIFSDSNAIAEAAAKELLLLSIDDFAFIGWPDPVKWSAERGRRFGQIIDGHGKRVQSFRMPKSSRPESDLAKLERFLLALPHPCGIFTANDVLAKQVVIACTHAGISIPDDIAIVSVDNDEDICEHSAVSITSIELDFTGAGTMSAELLNQLMSGERRNTRKLIFGVNRLVRRKSAIGFRHLDKRMNNALEYIRLHACEKISVPSVVNVMGCSRRLADLRFRTTLGRTILDKIHLQKLESAKILLRHHEPIEAIAVRCGYASSDDFRRVFKRYMKTSPLDWRRRQGNQT